jgi:hypothetical protein
MGVILLAGSVGDNLQKTRDLATRRDQRRI